LIFTALTGCVRSDGRNSDCNWPGEPEAKTLDLTQLWNQLHLSQDAEFAEELAIRYADTHHGLRSKYFNSRETYREARDQCLEAMCKEIGQAHGVTSATVFESLGRNRAGIDLAVNLPFVLLYGFVASVMAGRVWRRYPPEDGWRVSVAIVVLTAVRL
jgi:hypothetical protein